MGPCEEFKVYLVTDCDYVAARSAQEALNYMMEEMGNSADDLYTLEEVVECDLDNIDVWIDIDDIEFPVFNRTGHRMQLISMNKEGDYVIEVLVTFREYLDRLDPNAPCWFCGQEY